MGILRDAVRAKQNKLQERRGDRRREAHVCHEAGKDPKQMSAEEKGNVWKNKTLQL